MQIVNKLYFSYLIIILIITNNACNAKQAMLPICKDFVNKPVIKIFFKIVTVVLLNLTNKIILKLINALIV